MIKLKTLVETLIKEDRIKDASAKYEVVKDKVIVRLSGKSSGRYTKLSQEIIRMDQRIKELKAITDPLTQERLALDKELTVKKDALRDKVIEEVFDETEKMLSLAVEGLGATIAIDKHTDRNDPSIEYRAGDVISINYEKAWDTLMTLFPDLTGVGEDIIKKVSQVATEDKIKPGVRRALNVKVQEGIFSGIMNFINQITARIRQRFNKIENKLKNIKLLINQ